MAVTYDNEADAAYIYLNEGKSVANTKGEWPFHIDIDEVVFRTGASRPNFLTRNDVMIAVAPRRGAHRADVRASIRFGH